MEAPKKGWFQNFRDKTSKMLKKKRRRQAPDKKSLKETLNSQLPPLSTSEDSGVSNGETTVDLPKSQDDQTTDIFVEEQCSTAPGQWVKHSLDLSKVFFIYKS